MKVSNAIVLGAGIGGLAAATALAQRGVAVTLIEQAGEIREVGAGLQVSPNGYAVLRALGLSTALEAAGAVPARAVSLRDYRKGSEVARLDMARLRPDQKYFFMHRADLVSILLQGARRANVTLELGQQAASVRPGPVPEVQLADGTRRRAEVLVAADGIHSVARPVLNGADKTFFTGQVAWRALVPGDGTHPPRAEVHMGPGRHIVSYPLREGRLINLVAVQEREAWAEEGWHHADDPANLRSAFSDFGGRAEALLEAVEKCTLWGLHRHPVAPVWQREGVALLGDAAHPTLPFLAQGANLALEDAWVLADAVTREGPAGLATYQQRRMARVARVIKTAEGNAWRYHLPHGPVRWAAHLGLRAGSRLAPGMMVGAFDWLYGHDVTKAD